MTLSKLLLLSQGAFHQRPSIVHRTTQNLITRTKDPVYRDSSPGKLGREVRTLKLPHQSRILTATAREAYCC